MLALKELQKLSVMKIFDKSNESNDEVKRPYTQSGEVALNPDGAGLNPIKKGSPCSQNKLSIRTLHVKC